MGFYPGAVLPVRCAPGCPCGRRCPTLGTARGSIVTRCQRDYTRPETAAGRVPEQPAVRPDPTPIPLRETSDARNAKR